jgi:hypothetical protein
VSRDEAGERHPTFPIWLLGDSEAKNSRIHLDGPLDPRHPQARHNNLDAHPPRHSGTRALPESPAARAIDRLV